MSCRCGHSLIASKRSIALDLSSLTRIAQCTAHRCLLTRGSQCRKNSSISSTHQDTSASDRISAGLHQLSASCGIEINAQVVQMMIDSDRGCGVVVKESIHDAIQRNKSAGVRRGELILKVPTTAMLLARRKADNRSTDLLGLGTCLADVAETNLDQEDSNADGKGILMCDQLDSLFPISAVGLSLEVPWDIALALLMQDLQSHDLATANRKAEKYIHFWTTYIDEILPSIHQLCMPFCMPIEVLKECQHSELIQAALLQRERIAQLNTITSPGEVDTSEKLTSLFACVRSRAFEVYDNVFAFVPFLDLCNHSRQPNSAWNLISDNDRDSYIILKATEDIKPGTEITICYDGVAVEEVDGEATVRCLHGKTDRAMFAQYGFVVENNSFDKLSWRECSDTVEKLAALSSAPCSTSDIGDVALDASRMREVLGEREWEMGMTRKDGILSCILSSIPFINARKSHDGSESKFANMEMRASIILIEWAKNQLNLCATSIEVDEKLLTSSELSMQLNAAIHYRIKRKKVFQRTIQVLTRYVLSFSDPEEGKDT